MTDPTDPPPRVRLRDITLADADLMDAWGADPTAAGTFNDFGETHEPIDRDVLAAGPLRNERNGQLIVERIEDARPIGAVSWHVVGYGPTAGSRAWNIGIALLPDERGHGYGVEAQVQLAQYLFESTAFNRVEAQTDVENVAEQRALERAGFQREGIARGSQYRAGAYHDLVVYSRLRDDPPA
ncbi:MAG TPA: GNAT family protein [Candidatus Limnocylindrales bacterium]|nr:GNAT family protein [Candidatus Limnocylindrales bacterium]